MEWYGLPMKDFATSVRIGRLPAILAGVGREAGVSAAYAGLLPVFLL
jgi:hypothetical protein